MSATDTTTIHATAEQINAVSKSHGDSDAAIVARIKSVRAAVLSGVKVKTLADDLAAVAVDNPEINAVSSTILGFANAASEAADLSGVDFGEIAKATLVTFYRAAKRVKVKAFRDGMRAAIKSVGDDATAADRLEILLDAAEIAYRTRQAIKTTTREANGQGGTSESSGSESSGSVADAAAAAGLTVPADPSRDALAGIRSAVRYLSQGGELTADMRSAIAELTAAASAAGKRNRALAAV